MKGKKTLLLVILLILAAWKLLLPDAAEGLRAWAGALFGPKAEQKVAAMGRSLTAGEERVAALGPGNGA